MKIRATLWAVVFALAGIAGAVAAIQNHTSSTAAQAKLRAIIAGPQRSDAHKARDRYRHPFETLTFFGVEPNLTVVEIWPGGQGGWYREILTPFLRGRGHYIPLTGRAAFPDPVKAVPDGGADMVLVFRAHGFMIYDRPAQSYFNAIYRMLKPGGIFGIVDHRGNEAVPQDPKGKNGYVNQSHVLELAAKAGFKLLAESQVNANPKDDKAHPNGVWSLPPTLKGSRWDAAARKKYLAIGESDRFTLKFYKPVGD